MTTSKLCVQYNKSTDKAEPSIQISLYTSTYTYFKLFLYSLIGRPILLWHVLTDAETEALARLTFRWRIVKKLKESRKV